MKRIFPLYFNLPLMLTRSFMLLTLAGCTGTTGQETPTSQPASTPQVTFATLATQENAAMPQITPPGKTNLSLHDQQLLTQARTRGDTTVNLLIASQPGKNQTVADGVVSLGGTIRHRDDDVSYIRAIIPIDKVGAAATLSGVQTANLDETIPLDDPKP